MPLQHLRRGTAAAVMLLLALAGPAQAGIEQELDDMFNSLSNTTQPGAFNSQMSGTLAGGQYVLKNRIASINLLSVAPPRFDAGCGGIDLFAGSFTFINTAQFTQLLRSVASNAAGYAFQLALSNICPECASTVESLARKVQEMNQMFANSCQLAQGVVNDATSAFDLKGRTDASLLGTFAGAGDVFSMWTTQDGTSPDRKAKEADADQYDKEVRGNIVWRALKKGSVASWFAHGDNAMLETIMAMTGTVILGEDEAPAEGGDPAPKRIHLPPLKIGVRQLVFGFKDQPVYRCDTYGEDGCLDPRVENGNLSGFVPRLSELLLGGPDPTSSSGGLVAKMAANEPESEAERAIAAAFLPATFIRQLAKLNEPVARLYTTQILPQLAIEMARTMLEDMLTSARVAIGTAKEAWAEDARSLVMAAWPRLTEEIATLYGEYGQPAAMVQAYQAYLEAMDKPVIQPAAASAATKE